MLLSEHDYRRLHAVLEKQQPARKVLRDAAVQGVAGYGLFGLRNVPLNVGEQHLQQAGTLLHQCRRSAATSRPVPLLQNPS
jgi:hypothetical protein